MLRIPNGLHPDILDYKIQRNMEKKKSGVVKVEAISSTKKSSSRDKNQDFYQRNGVFLELSDAAKEMQERRR